MGARLQGSVILSEAKNLANQRMRSFYVYMMTNRSGTLYVGMTNNLERRVAEHRLGFQPGFTNHYKMDRLVYYEEAPDANSAIAREKQLKGWVRRKKVALIGESNPRWADLLATWVDEGLDPSLRSG